MQTANKNRFSFAMILAIVAALGFSTTACNEDEGSGQVILESFGPSPVDLGGQVTFIGQNLDKVSSIDFPSGYTVSDFIERSSGKIVVKATADTAQAYEGFVVLHTSGGDITTKTKIGYSQSAVISAITGAAKPGADITITGSYLSSVQKVVFGGDVEVYAEDFKQHQNGSIVVAVPEEAKSGKIQIYNGIKYIFSEQELGVSLPAISGITSTPVKPGADNFTISGTDLDLVETVILDGTEFISDNFVSQSATSIVVALPKDIRPGTVKVVAASGVEVESKDALAFVKPVFSAYGYDGTDGFQPDGLPVKSLGDEITFTGTNLDLVKSIFFGDGEATEFTLSKDNTSLTVKIPASGTVKNQDPDLFASRNNEAGQWSSIYSGWQNAFKVRSVAYDNSEQMVGFVIQGWGMKAEFQGFEPKADNSAMLATIYIAEKAEFIQSVSLDGAEIKDAWVSAAAGGQTATVEVPMKYATSCPVTVTFANGMSSAINVPGSYTKPAAPVVTDVPKKLTQLTWIEVSGINFTKDTKFYMVSGGQQSEIDVAYRSSESFCIKLPTPGTYDLKVSDSNGFTVMKGLSVTGEVVKNDVADFANESISYPYTLGWGGPTISMTADKFKSLGLKAGAKMYFTAPGETGNIQIMDINWGKDDCYTDTGKWTPEDEVFELELTQTLIDHFSSHGFLMQGTLKISKLELY